MRYCQRCGELLQKAQTGRERRYCSDRCKQTAYRTRLFRRGLLGKCGGLLDYWRDQGLPVATVARLEEMIYRYGPGAAEEAGELLLETVQMINELDRERASFGRKDES